MNDQTYLNRGSNGQGWICSLYSLNLLIISTPGILVLEACFLSTSCENGLGYWQSWYHNIWWTCGALVSWVLSVRMGSTIWFGNCIASLWWYWYAPFSLWLHSRWLICWTLVWHGRECLVDRNSPICWPACCSFLSYTLRPRRLI
jgi:hypothetical protein